MGSSEDIDPGSRLEWAARIVVGAVFAMNVWCALSFVAEPAAFAAAYELSGVPGETAVRGIGVAFLMWNVTYPLVVVRPSAHLTLFAVVLAQQVVGLAGEVAIMLALPPGHAALAASLMRFVACDAAALVAMGVAFALLWREGRVRS